jgi:type 1 fimbria pilin
MRRCAASWSTAGAHRSSKRLGPATEGMCEMETTKWTKALAAILLLLAVTTAATAVGENTVGRGNASRACTLVLASDADIGQWSRCVITVGNQHPTNAALQGCPSAIGWHSQSDGRTAGLKIGTCFRA